MKANELRIGNLVEFGNHIQGSSIETISARWFSSLAGGRPMAEIKPDEEINNYWRPIKLTDEWLLKLGAQKLPTTTYPRNMQNYCISDSKNNSFLFTLGSNGVEVFKGFILYKYVHQLQNLYYALTGEELTLHTGA